MQENICDHPGKETIEVPPLEGGAGRRKYRYLLSVITYNSGTGQELRVGGEGFSAGSSLVVALTPAQPGHRGDCI